MPVAAPSRAPDDYVFLAALKQMFGAKQQVRDRGQSDYETEKPVTGI
jgi:hypothetical protein